MHVVHCCSVDDCEDGSPPCSSQTSLEWRNDSNPPSPPSSPGLLFYNSTFNDYDITDTGMFTDVGIHLC